MGLPVAPEANQFPGQAVGMETTGIQNDLFPDREITAPHQVWTHLSPSIRERKDAQVNNPLPTQSRPGPELFKPAGNGALKVRIIIPADHHYIGVGEVIGDGLQPAGCGADIVIDIYQHISMRLLKPPVPAGVQARHGLTDIAQVSPLLHQTRDQLRRIAGLPGCGLEQ